MTRKAFFGTVYRKMRSGIGPGKALRPGEKALIALSGGPDSVALTHFLHRVAGDKGLRLETCHVHHGLRGKAADADARFCARLAKSLDLPHHEVRVDVPAEVHAAKRSVEDAARKLRYAALARAARSTGSTVVVTAHHLDDQAETVLLHLLRGTKAAGLKAMPARRALAPRVTLARPLLEMRRAELAAYLRFFGLRSRKDTTNTDERFQRNWVRRKLLPLMESRSPRIREHLTALFPPVK